MPFQPGNTLGRGRPPAGKSLSEALCIALAEKLPDVADALVAKARTGDISAVREVLDRTEGKVSARVELQGRAPTPIQFNILPLDLDTL